MLKTKLDYFCLFYLKKLLYKCINYPTTHIPSKASVYTVLLRSWIKVTHPFLLHFLGTDFSLTRRLQKTVRLDPSQRAKDTVASWVRIKTKLLSRACSSAWCAAHLWRLMFVLSDTSGVVSFFSTPNLFLTDAGMGGCWSHCIQSGSSASFSLLFSLGPPPNGIIRESSL